MPIRSSGKGMCLGVSGQHSCKHIVLWVPCRAEITWHNFEHKCPKYHTSTTLTSLGRFPKSRLTDRCKNYTCDYCCAVIELTIPLHTEIDHWSNSLSCIYSDWLSAPLCCLGHIPLHNTILNGNNQVLNIEILVCKTFSLLLSCSPFLRLAFS